MIKMTGKYSNWTQDSLQAMFGEGYVVVGSSPDRYDKLRLSRGFSVKKIGGSITVSYSKHMIDTTTREDYVEGIASVSCVEHRIKCYGSTHLKLVESDEDMVRQAKKVLDW